MSEHGDKLGSGSGYFKKLREGDAYKPISERGRERQKKAAAARRGGMKFVSLHGHSTFSFLDGFGLPDAHVERAADLGMEAIALTEHGNVFSHVKLEKAAEKYGVRPIFGCEFYVGWTDEKRKTQLKNHLTVLARNEVGYRNLLDLVSRSWVEGFYYQPTVDWSWLFEASEGLTVLSGCQGSALFTATVGGKLVPEEEASFERGLKVARFCSERLDDYYVEVQAFPELEKTVEANPLLAEIAKEIDRPLVATMDVHYVSPEEVEVQKILHNVRGGGKQSLEEQVADWGYKVPLCLPPSDRTIERRLIATGLSPGDAAAAIEATGEIASRCDVQLPKLPKVEYPLPDGFDSPTELWRAWLKEGWKFRGCDRLPKKELDRYREQLRKEMEVIEAKGYENYFLIVADSVKFAKDSGIPVGPARGSAAASLACYLLRITEVDPMDFDNLVFERFIDWSREDMPDVDVDFATYGRAAVRDYLEEKYGKGCVNNIGTFTMYKSKNALDDAARVYGVPKRDVETIKDLLIERSSGDLRASATIEDTVDQFDAANEVFNEHPELQFAMDLEGNAKGFGVHAAGLVISTRPITDTTAILEREVPAGSGNVVQVVSMDKYDAERQGLEKLDYLGLKTMDAIAETIHQIDMSLDDLYAIPLDDPETIDGFRKNDVVGVFQFDGRATRIVCGALKPDNFHEIVCVNALSRPGPLHNGAVEGYIGAKWKTSEPDRIHPALDDITADTMYQIIFQEQILRIVREIGDFSWTHSAYIRRIISKKLGDQEFNRQGEKFMEGAATLHERTDYPPIDEATARKVWGMCTTAGSYAFNAAHSTSYSKIAFWCMFLKIHYPAAFFAGSLATIVTEEKIAGLRRDAVKHGVEVLPPSIDSDRSWRVENDRAIRAGWTQIPGIGSKVADRINDFLDEQGGITSFDDLTAIPGIGPKSIEKIETFCESEDPFEIRKLDDAIEKVTTGIRSGELGKLPTPNVTAAELYDVPANAPVVFLGQVVKRNLRDVFEANQAKTGVALKESEVKDAHLSQWVVLTVRDGDDLGTFLASRYRYPALKDRLWSIDPDSDELILIEGKKGSRPGHDNDQAALAYIDNLWVIDPE